MVQQAIINATVFTGDEVLEQHAVVFADGRITAVLPMADLPPGIAVSDDLAGAYLIPGLIDLQVNGGGGYLFNAQPTVETLRHIGAAHSQYGTSGFLPTLITTDFAVMQEAIAAVAQAIQEGVPGILGIHLEGPFLNAEKKGVHDPEKFCLLDDAGFELITSLQPGKTLVTLAPEMTSLDMITKLAAAGVVVSAGHTNADYDGTVDALAAGMTGFTHLFNAMPAFSSRAPGVVGAALSDQDSWFGIIADGHHVHPASFRVAVNAKPCGKALLVTDAMATVGAEEKSFTWNGEVIHVQDGRLQNSEGRLAGSDLDMLAAVNNAAAFAGLDWFESVRMASPYPARALGLDNELGYIKPGYRASMVALKDKGTVQCNWVDGAKVYQS